MKAPKGKLLSMVKVGEKGQIVIPKEAREMFGIAPGDTIVIAADEKRGIALLNGQQMEKLLERAMQFEMGVEEE